MAHMDPADLVKQPQDSTECPYTVDPSRIKGKEVCFLSSDFINLNTLCGHSNHGISNLWFSISSDSLLK